jgi:ribonucleoside-diphosphate reductase beta chain
MLTIVHGSSSEPVGGFRPAALDRTSFPMRLWSKAKAQGTWDPEIDFSADRAQWPRLPDGWKRRLLQLCVLFHAGEEAVSRGLLPFIMVAAGEGRREEELYLASLLWEEAKHVDLFDRFMAEVVEEAGDLSRFYHSGYARILERELRPALARLASNPTPEAQVDAAVTFHLVTEGIMAEAGYYLVRRMLGGTGMLPAFQQAIARIQRDESRHIAFGLYYLSRLIVEHGNPAYKAFLSRMSALKPIVERSAREFFNLFDDDQSFGITLEDLFRFSERKFAARVEHLVRARTLRIEDLNTKFRFEQAMEVA